MVLSDNEGVGVEELPIPAEPNGLEWIGEAIVSIQGTPLGIKAAA
jgi:hypothetical protein